MKINTAKNKIMPNSNSTLKNKIYINFFLLLITFIIIYFFGLPIYNGGGQNILNFQDSIQTLLQEKANYNAAILSSKDYFKKIQTLNKSYSTITASPKATDLQNMIPANIDPVAVIHELSNIVTLSGMELTSPRFSENSESNRNSYNTLSLDFSVKGNYQNLKLLLKNLEDSKRIYNLKAVSFASAADTKNISHLTFQISLETYYLKNSKN